MQATHRMTREDQKNRRQKIAAAVRDASSLGSVAAKFGVSIETVKNACRTYAPEKLYGTTPARTSKRTTASTAAAI